MITPGIIPTKAELQEEVDRLRADNAALRADKERLDWRIENLCIAEPAFALKLADALESEALLHEAGGVTKYVPCLRGFAADIRRHHAAFTANAKGQP